MAALPGGDDKLILFDRFWAEVRSFSTIATNSCSLSPDAAPTVSVDRVET